METWIVASIVTCCSLYAAWRAWRWARGLSSRRQAECACSCTDCPEADRPGPDCQPGARKLALIAILALAAPSGAQAADTIETWAVGATDVDFYLGLDGLGRRAADNSLGADIMFGYGITEGFSAYLGAAMAADGRLRNGGGSLYTGLFGTPLDTDHVDLDLLLNLELTGEAYTQFGLAPGLELVYTSHPEMLGWGLYLRSFAHMTGAQDEPAADGHAIHVGLATTLGAFVTLAEDHQLLLELDGTFRPWRDQADPRHELGGLALGYNLALTPAIELINQVYIDLPQAGSETVAVGIMVGFIATLPAG